jgi:hypothetical protein
LAGIIRYPDDVKTIYRVQVPTTTANSQRVGYANHDLIPEREGQERRKGVKQNNVMRQLHRKLQTLIRAKHLSPVLSYVIGLGLMGQSAKKLKLAVDK